VSARPLLVLGAGEDQLPVYREARRRGIATIAVDGRPDRPARALADTYLEISTRDADAVVEALGPIRPCGVITAASDAALATVHELSKRFETPYVLPREAVLASQDKTRFHEVAAAAGVPRYRWVSGRDPEALLREALALSFPLVAKPTDATGSRGATFVAGPQALPAALDAAFRAAYAGEVVVEEFVEGRNLTVDLFLRAGSAAVAAISEKRLLGGDGFVIEGHTCPAALEPAVRDRLVAAATRLALAVGLADGPCNLDFILAPDDTAYALELGARTCGNGFPHMLRAILGVDVIAAAVSLAVGEPFELASTRSRHGLLRVLASPIPVPGVLVEMTGVERAAAVAGVELVELYVAPGERVLPFTEAAAKLGYVIASGDGPGEAQVALDGALAELRFVVEPLPEEAHVVAA
jgi:biotin carboxylase